MLVYLMVDRKQESLTWVNTMNESPNHYNFIDRCVISYLTRHFNLDFQSVTSRKELHGSFFSVFCIQKVVPFWKLWTTLWISWWYCFLHIFFLCPLHFACTMVFSIINIYQKLVNTFILLTTTKLYLLFALEVRYGHQTGFWIIQCRQK